MTEWMIAAAVLFISMLGLGVLVPRMMAKRPRGGGGGIIVGLLMVFSSVFDPAQKSAVVQLDRIKGKERSEEEESGDRPE
jgi:hypothetical protein